VRLERASRPVVAYLGGLLLQLLSREEADAAAAAATGGGVATLAATTLALGLARVLGHVAEGGLFAVAGRLLQPPPPPPSPAPSPPPAPTGTAGAAAATFLTTRLAMAAAAATTAAAAAGGASAAANGVPQPPLRIAFPPPRAVEALAAAVAALQPGFSALMQVGNAVFSAREQGRPLTLAALFFSRAHRLVARWDWAGAGGGSVPAEGAMQEGAQARTLRVWRVMLRQAEAQMEAWDRGEAPERALRAEAAAQGLQRAILDNAGLPRAVGASMADAPAAAAAALPSSPSALLPLLTARLGQTPLGAHLHAAAWADAAEEERGWAATEQRAPALGMALRAACAAGVVLSGAPPPPPGVGGGDGGADCGADGASGALSGPLDVLDASAQLAPVLLRSLLRKWARQEERERGGGGGGAGPPPTSPPPAPRASPHAQPAEWSQLGALLAQCCGVLTALIDAALSPPCAHGGTTLRLAAPGSAGGVRVRVAATLLRLLLSLLSAQLAHPPVALAAAAGRGLGLGGAPVQGDAWWSALAGCTAWLVASPWAGLLFRSGAHPPAEWSAVLSRLAALLNDGADSRAATFSNLIALVGEGGTAAAAPPRPGPAAAASLLARFARLRLAEDEAVHPLPTSLLLSTAAACEDAPPDALAQWMACAPPPQRPDAHLEGLFRALRLTSLGWQLASSAARLAAAPSSPNPEREEHGVGGGAQLCCSADGDFFVTGSEEAMGGGGGGGGDQRRCAVCATPLPQAVGPNAVGCTFCGAARAEAEGRGEAEDDLASATRSDEWAAGDGLSEEGASRWEGSTSEGDDSDGSDKSGGAGGGSRSGSSGRGEGVERGGKGVGEAGDGGGSSGALASGPRSGRLWQPEAPPPSAKKPPQQQRMLVDALELLRAGGPNALSSALALAAREGFSPFVLAPDSLREGGPGDAALAAPSHLPALRKVPNILWVDANKYNAIRPLGASVDMEGSFLVRFLQRRAGVALLSNSKHKGWLRVVPKAVRPTVRAWLAARTCRYALEKGGAVARGALWAPPPREETDAYRRWAAKMEAAAAVAAAAAAQRKRGGAGFAGAGAGGGAPAAGGGSPPGGADGGAPRARGTMDFLTRTNFGPQLLPQEELLEKPLAQKDEDLELDALLANLNALDYSEAQHGGDEEAECGGEQERLFAGVSSLWQG
jgi:transposase-like protein